MLHNTVINSIPTAYREEGTGRDVLFLHGWGVDGSTFDPVIARLSASFHCVAPDFPGFGGTPEPDRPWSSADFAAFTAAFIETLGLHDPVIVGHSNGGRTALRLLGEGYKAASKLVLLGAAGLRPAQSAGRSLRNFVFKCGKAVLKLPFLKKYREKLAVRFGSEDYKNASPLLRRTLVTLLGEDLRPLLPNILVPTLLVWGEADTAVPISDAEIMCREIPNAGLVRYPGCGHYAFLQNLPNFCSTLEYFITH